MRRKGFHWDRMKNCDISASSSDKTDCFFVLGFFPIWFWDIFPKTEVIRLETLKKQLMSLLWDGLSGSVSSYFWLMIWHSKHAMWHMRQTRSTERFFCFGSNQFQKNWEVFFRVFLLKPFSWRMWNHPPKNSTKENSHFCWGKQMLQRHEHITNATGLHSHCKIPNGHFYNMKTFSPFYKTTYIPWSFIPYSATCKIN